MAGETLIGKDQTRIPGYLNESAGQGKPSLLVISEWWGVNAQMRGVVDRLAAEGFVAFAPDLFHGKIATDAASAESMAGSLDWTEAKTSFKRAVAALTARDPQTQIGVIGYCLGGSLALAAAATLPTLRACVAFYGIPSDEKADVSKIRAAVMGHYASDDDWCSPERVDRLEKRLKAAGVSAQIYRYDAQHAFCNERRPEVYSQQNAQLAWTRTVEFLKRTLS
jgi:carboxymethylenebutenolidase